MTSIVQIVLCIIVTHWAQVRPQPFGEINVKRSFDVAFKPLPFKPFAFIKEKWSPFGTYGIKHGIAKRDLDKINTIPVAKPYVGIPIGGDGLSRLPAAVYEIEPKELVPVSITPQIAPVPAPPPPRVVIVTPVPIKEPVQGFRTNIGRDDMISEYLKSVELQKSNYPLVQEEKVLPPISNTIVPDKPKDIPPPPVKEEPANPFVRGSRLALYFGNILVEVLTQFLHSTKTTNGQFSDQPVPI